MKFFQKAGSENSYQFIYKNEIPNSEPNPEEMLQDEVSKELGNLGKLVERNGEWGFVNDITPEQGELIKNTPINELFRFSGGNVYVGRVINSEFAVNMKLNDFVNWLDGDGASFRALIKKVFEEGKGSLTLTQILEGRPEDAGIKRIRTVLPNHLGQSSGIVTESDVNLPAGEPVATPVVKELLRVNDLLNDIDSLGGGDLQQKLNEIAGTLGIEFTGRGTTDGRLTVDGKVGRGTLAAKAKVLKALEALPKSGEEEGQVEIETGNSDLETYRDLLGKIPENGVYRGDEVRGIQEKLKNAGHYNGKIDGIAGGGTRRALEAAINKIESGVSQEYLETLENTDLLVTSGETTFEKNGREVKAELFDHIQQYFQNRFGVLVAYHEIMLVDPNTGETFDIPDGPYEKRSQRIERRNGEIVNRGRVTTRRTSEGRLLDSLADRFARGELVGTLRNKPNPRKGEGISPMERIDQSKDRRIEAEDVLEGSSTVEVKYPTTDTIKEVIAKLLRQGDVAAFFEGKGIDTSDHEAVAPYLYQEVSGARIPIGDKFIIRCGTEIGVSTKLHELTPDPEMFFNGQPCGGSVLCPAFVDLPAYEPRPPTKPVKPAKPEKPDPEDPDPEDPDPEDKSGVGDGTAPGGGEAQGNEGASTDAGEGTGDTSSGGTAGALS